MKSRRNTILAMLLGVMLVAFAVAIAQTTPQGEQKTKAEACCSMDTCCCNGGTCPMMNKDATANAGAKHDCDCCTGDSCPMKKSEQAKNHAEEKGCCCCGESCDMKTMKHDAKTMKHDMKHDATMMKHDMKPGNGKAACCNMKHKEAKIKTKKAA